MTKRLRSIRPQKRYGCIVCMVCILMCFASCIELTDELTLNEDGSGTLKISLDLGMVAGAMNNGNTQFDLSLLDKIKAVSANAPATLSGIRGISNVHSVTEEKKGLYSLSLDFTDSKSLNKGLYQLFGSEKNAISPSLIRISHHKMVRKDLSPYIRNALKNQKTASANQMLYSFIRLNSIVHLPADLISAENIKTKQEGPRTVSTSFTLQDVLEGKFNCGNIIKF